METTQAEINPRTGNIILRPNDMTVETFVGMN